jgi:hypothetical protein
MRYKHFEYQFILFKLANALATFWIYINKILQELINITCIIYIDNILVY